jgi:hypothetical protein
VRRRTSLSALAAAVPASALAAPAVEAVFGFHEAVRGGAGMLELDTIMRTVGGAFGAQIAAVAPRDVVEAPSRG